MKKVFLIRHAESEANVSKTVFPYDNIIKLTENGKKQAKDLCEVIEKPDRIFVSKFIRTIETAEPIIEKYPEALVHLWIDTHEFDPIHDTRNFQGTFDDFKIQYNFFWEKGDPFYKDKEHAESFAEFTDRLSRVILKLKKIPDGVNYVFTHGWFIKMFYMMTSEFKDFEKTGKDISTYKKIFDRFIAFDQEFKTKNTGIYEVTDLVEKYAQNVL